MSSVSASPFVSLFIENGGNLVEVGHEIDLGLKDDHILVFRQNDANFEVDFRYLNRYSKAESQWSNGINFSIFKFEFHQTSVILLAQGELREQIENYMSFFFQNFFQSTPYEIIDNWQGKTFDKFVLILENEYNLTLGSNEAGVMGLVPMYPPFLIKKLAHISPMFPSSAKISNFSSDEPVASSDYYSGRKDVFSCAMTRKDSNKENTV